MLIKYSILLGEYEKEVIRTYGFEVDQNSPVELNGFYGGLYLISVPNEETGAVKKLKIKPGRLLKKIIKGNISDEVLENMVERITSMYTANLISNDEETRKDYKFIISNEISKYYDGNITVMEGGLGKNCMLYNKDGETIDITEKKLRQLSFYEENDEIKIALLLRKKDNKVVSRSIVWNVSHSVDGEKFWAHDRVYFVNQLVRELMAYHLKLNNIVPLNKLKRKVYFMVKDGKGLGYGTFFDSMKREKDLLSYFPISEVLENVSELLNDHITLEQVINEIPGENITEFIDTLLAEAYKTRKMNFRLARIILNIGSEWFQQRTHKTIENYARKNDDTDMLEWLQHQGQKD